LLPRPTTLEIVQISLYQCLAQYYSAMPRLYRAKKILTFGFVISYEFIESFDFLRFSLTVTKS